jgi:hypothetical protein
VCIVTDWAPGAEASKVFDQHFIKGGGQVLDTLKVPLANRGRSRLSAWQREVREVREVFSS